MIEKPEWYQLCENIELRQYFVDQAKGFTRNTELQEDLYQEAWLGIGEYLDSASGEKALEFYKTIGYRAMKNYYHREWRGHRLVRRGKDYKRNKNAVKVRKFRAKKKFEKNVNKSAQTVKGYSENTYGSGLPDYDPSVKPVDEYYRLMNNARHR